ncbi:MAG: transcriptional repressor LexA [Selenomonas sp.]|nr:transcriptional repressor LexA [Selenomonas sp.]
MFTLQKKNKTSAERQEQIYEYLKKFQREHSYPPSVREIGAAVGLKSASTVHGYLRCLEERGLIERQPDKRRALDIVGEKPRQDFVRVPLVGTVAAGLPILAEQNLEDVYELPKSMVHNSEDVFMLRVHGDSMINIGILEDDFVIVRQQSDASNGDIVVALVNGESATVKRYFLESDCVRLQPENDNMEPFYERNVRILGKVIGVYRQM